jgi:Uma2 family endonuclease
MSTTATATRYTPEDLLKMPDGDRYELVDGRLVGRNMSMWSSFVAGRIFGLLAPFCEQNRLGWPFPEGTSYRCFPSALEKVRRPDFSFIRLSRLPLATATTEGHCPIAPDLAVEVMSPNDLAYEVDEKVQEFLAAGVPLVWVVNPQQRTVEVHRPNATGTILRENDEITGEDVITGFRCRVGDFFIPPAGAAAGDGRSG